MSSTLIYDDPYRQTAEKRLSRSDEKEVVEERRIPAK